MAIPSKADLYKAVVSKESTAVGVLGALAWIADEFLKHAIFSKLVDGVGQIIGGPEMSKALLAHPILFSLTILALWIAFVLWWASRGEPHASSREKELPLSMPKGRVKASGNKSKAAGRDITETHNYYGPHTPSQQSTKPQITLRIVASEVKRIPRMISLKEIDGKLDVEVKSVVTVTFSALNTEPCSTTLDRCSMLIETPSGNLPTTNADLVPYELNGHQLNKPSGIFSLELNAPLTHGNTITRYVNWLVKEVVTIPSSDNTFPLAMEQLVTEARAATAYEKVGRLRLTVVDSFGLSWEASAPVSQ